MFEHVVAEYDYSFVLKTDDDSFVNVPALVTDLRGKCTTPGCHNERLYMGFQVRRLALIMCDSSFSSHVLFKY